MALALSKLALLPRPRAITDGAGSCPGQPVSRRVQPENLPAQGYRIRLDASGVELVGADPAGLFYAEATLAQVKRQAAGELPAGALPPGALPTGVIEDGPDYAVRGVMLDISRDKVPTMETLESLVDLLSSLKVNHLQLYTEHTFAYSNHREVWAEASPMTADEIRRLDAHCRQRFVELAPNQNSFGHLERWLALPRYIGLSECPKGFDWPWGGRSEGPFSLDPSNPASLSLLEELFDELLPAFTSRLFNVGCDETFDLGQGRNRERCEREGKGRVYLQFLKEIHRRVTQRGCTMLYWGDIIMEHPELVPELPRDAIALEWGYESHHPFDGHGAKYRAAGVPWWVCPGTSSWNSFAGRTENCLGNLRAAARAGLQHGATGFLNTDWGDNGHWQFLPVSWPGLAAGAALSWCVGANGETDFASELDAHVFGDRAAVMGAAARDLGNAYLHTGVRIHNESALFQVLRHPDRTAAPQGVTAGAVADTRAWIQAAAARLAGARMDRADAALVLEEYALTVRLMLLGCDRLDALVRGASPLPPTEGQLAEIVREYRRLWLARNRPGGLADSVRRLQALGPR